MSMRSINSDDKIQCDCGKLIEWNDWIHKSNCLEYSKTNGDKTLIEIKKTMNLIKKEEVNALYKQILLRDYLRLKSNKICK